ncbi:MAG: hypothetical protein ABI140_00185 [Jatrophihabitantaceae bacterium]
MTPTAGDRLSQARAVADAVLYEGYLLYPYRATAAKNQFRWQFGVLGPPAAKAGIGEPAGCWADCLLAAGDASTATLTVYLRFLQLQARQVHDSSGEPVAELALSTGTVLSWDEAVAHELAFGPLPLAKLRAGLRLPVLVAGGTDREPIVDRGRLAGELVRNRLPLQAELHLSVEPVEPGAVQRLRIVLTNLTELAEPDSRPAALAGSLLGSHLLVTAQAARFVSLLDPPAQATSAAQACRNERCWPVLASPADDVLLLSPIILYDYPELAPQSAGALFDSTEIDEILTLRVLTMTEAEKAEARATDPAAATIIDRCESMSAADLQQLHGVMRDPRLAERPGLDGPVPSTPIADGEQPWWDPGMDASVSPETDSVLVGGVAISKGSLVRLQPKRRADAQDLFFDGQSARVTAVLADVDGNTHLAVVLTDDPAADLHEWYGRYLYFAPEEVEPLPVQPDAATLIDTERRAQPWQPWES